MNFYSGDSFNQIYFQMLSDAYYSNISLTSSRNGDVKDLGRSVYQIKNDKFRLCFIKERKINLFFVFAEFSWIISGSNKLEELEYFISSYNKFSDDGLTLNGAYGYRLRKYFQKDQIGQAIKLLKQDNDTRRVVLTMYSPEDLFKTSKDIPCNTTIYLKIRNNQLDITILNRSNDLYLGVPYNVFVFYLLQAYIAHNIGCDIGVQTHYTDSLHLYQENKNSVKNIIDNNSIEVIKNIEKKFQTFDNSKYALIEHANVLNRKYDLIENSTFRDMFLIYRGYKYNDLDNCVKIPQNLIGYCINNWLNSKNKNISKGYNMSNMQVLESLKYKNTLEIVTILKSIGQDNLSKFDEFEKLISESSGNSILKLKIEDKQRYINIMLLVLVLESLSSNLYNRELREELMGKIQEVCVQLEIDIGDVFYFTKYESEIRQIIR